ncbi:hypothetical protein HRG84_09205 [Flavisolibacter sp. BT320]|nr:hypothetical protein [Flavisolibacter longurius]
MKQKQHSITRLLPSHQLADQQLFLAKKQLKQPKKIIGLLDYAGSNVGSTHRSFLSKSFCLNYSSKHLQTHPAASETLSLPASCPAALARGFRKGKNFSVSALAEAVRLKPIQDRRSKP